MRRSLLRTVTRAFSYSGSFRFSSSFQALRTLRSPDQRLWTGAAMTVNCVTNGIIKSPEEKREFRGVELSNGLRVLLVSDSTTDKASAAMDVHIGSLSDPDDIPGLAHFCEHMLFLGTKKYPQENEYSEFLSQHAGSSNAFTNGEHTNFFFDVSKEHLEGALDRFAQFFLCPLFDPCCKDREVNAVDSENEKNLMSDSWRLFQLEKSTGNKKHPFCKFGTGNKFTLETRPNELGLDVRNELLKFHSKFYSANLMALCVLGKESLDELMDLVIKLFSEVENKNVPVPHFPDHPYQEEHLRQMYKIVPVKDIRNLYVTFPIPDLQPFYKSNPGHYLGHLIGHEGPGSLLSLLKSKGWVNTLVGGQKEGARGFMFFIINVDLTEDGLEHIEEIVSHMFQYINMLRAEGPKEWIFQECKVLLAQLDAVETKAFNIVRPVDPEESPSLHHRRQKLSAMAFRFKDKEKPQNCTSRNANLLHYYPFSEVLLSNYMLEEFKPDLIDMVLNKLHPENARVSVVAKSFESLTNTEERWYGTQYVQVPVSEETCQKWRNSSLNEKFSLPMKNDFIPTKLDTLPLEPDASPVPQLIKNSALSKLWFKQDDAFFLPKACLNFEFYSPFAYMDPLHCNLTYLYVQLLKDSLNEYAYDAELAGLTYSLQNTIYGINLAVKGYEDKQLILLLKIVEKMSNFQIDQRRFDIMKELYLRSLHNFRAEQPHRHALYYLRLLLTELAWTKDELREALDEVTLPDLQRYIPQFLSRLHMECLFHGNLTKKEALHIQSQVEECLASSAHSKALLPSQLIRYRQVQLPDRGWFIFQQKNEVHNNCGVEIYFQSDVQSTHDNMLLELVCQIIAEPCFHTLRTQEQLGYIVFSGPRRANGVQGLHFIIQSERPPMYLEQRVEAFLHSMMKIIADMSPTSFAKHVEALALSRLEKPKKLWSESAKHWGEIISQQYDFDRDNKEVKHLRTLTKEDILQFYEEVLVVGAPHRRKISVHVQAREPPPDAVELTCPTEQLLPVPELAQPVMIEDMTEFKRMLPLFPLIKPSRITAKL